jgi:hypothetical protein
VLQRLQTVKIMRSHSHLYWILRLNTHDFKMWLQIFFYTNLYCWLSLLFFHVQLANALFFRWIVEKKNILIQKFGSQLEADYNSKKSCEKSRVIYNVFVNIAFHVQVFTSFFCWPCLSSSWWDDLNRFVKDFCLNVRI